MLYAQTDIAHIPAGLLTTWFHALAPERQERIRRLHRPEDQKSSIVAWTLARQALFLEHPELCANGSCESQKNLQLTQGVHANSRKPYSNLQLARGIHGKPYLVHHPDIFFNIAHTPGASVCAVDHAAVGCDIEAVHRFETKSARATERLFKPQEVLCLRQAPAALKPFMATLIWTAREAVVKQHGGSIVGPDANFDLGETLLHTSAQIYSTLASIELTDMDHEASAVQRTTQPVMTCTWNNLQVASFFHNGYLYSCCSEQVLPHAAVQLCTP